MKKILLSFATLATCALAANAQNRLVLYEEFTGENCGPCAATNPHLDSVMELTNASKVLMIKYMSPIPSAGQFYYQNQPQTDARINYYGVPFAPYGAMDGSIPDQTTSDPGHPGYLTQADIDGEYNIASPFNISVTAAWSPDYNSITATITVQCVTAFAPAGANIVLQTALAETVDWATPPGNNGETHFPNVVRKMFPDENGTAVPAAWTAGQTATYTVTCVVPSYVDKTKSPFMAVWLQNNTDKKVAQAAKSLPLPTIAIDAASGKTTGPAGLICAGATYDAAHSVQLKNTGTTALTTATIYYSLDGGAYQSYVWNGNLAAGDSTTVAMPTATITISGAGYHSIVDSVAKPNSIDDVNGANNVSSTAFFIQNSIGIAEPATFDFESNTGQYYSVDLNANGEHWFIAQASDFGVTAAVGNAGSTFAAFHDNFQYQVPPVEVNILTMPTPALTSPSALDFYTAYKLYAGDLTAQDGLEVVYSADCGTTWTSIWSKAGTQLSSDTSSFFYVPATADYKLQSVDVSAVPAGSMFGFRATSAWGNNVWIDGAQFHTGTTAAVHNVAATTAISIYPNPAKDIATVSMTLATAADVTIVVSDAVGRTVNTINQNMASGEQKIELSTSAMAAGIYNIKIVVGNNVTTQRLSVVK